MLNIKFTGSPLEDLFYLCKRKRAITYCLHVAQRVLSPSESIGSEDMFSED